MSRWTPARAATSPAPGRQTRLGPRDAIFAEFYSHFADQHQFIKTVCTQRWKLNLFLLDDSELYDLQADPHEMTNLDRRPGPRRHPRSPCPTHRRLGLFETGDPLAPIVERAARALGA